MNVGDLVGLYVHHGTLHHGTLPFAKLEFVIIVGSRESHGEGAEFCLLYVDGMTRWVHEGVLVLCERFHARTA